MEKFNISAPNQIVDKSLYGGKSYWLSWLIQHGYRVPTCFFISAINEEELNEVKSFLLTNEEFNSLLNEYKTIDDNYEVAIRSSALNEDSTEKSFAGHFKSYVNTIPYEQLITNIENVVKSVKENDKNDTQRIGIVVQKKIDAKFSGVAFSSNPLNASKNELLVSVVEGMGEQLVSGKVAGEDILISYASNLPEIPEYKTDVDKNIIYELSNIAKEIERTLNFPVDIEWCVDKNNNELYILQCRPITAIFSEYTGIIPINLSSEHLIPTRIKENDKVKIRLIAQQKNIDISNAYLIINNNGSILDEDALSKIQPQERCKSYSLVLIFPKTISGNIIRHFAENEIKKQSTAFRTCQRYDVRSYQDYSNLTEIIQSIQTKCGEASWSCVTIIQEIFDPVFTGIAKKIDDGFLVEIAQGHFVPKGIVPTSQYILNNKNELLLKNEITQDIAYRISNGTVSKEEINTLISIDQDTLIRLVENLMPLLLGEAQAVEFGMLENKETKKLEPYLIDLVNDNSSVELSSKLISEGVISTGIRSGKAKTFDTTELGHDSLELHFHNEFENKNTINEDIIFITGTPDIALLEILKHYNNENIGFIFKEGSALSHFSIVLREKKIPAIIVGDHINIEDGNTIRIDAVSENIKGIDRISYGEACVTSYVNPDLDGISSSIVLAYYKTLKGKNHVPVYFGELDNETIFTLNYFKFEFPKQVSSVERFDSIVLVDTHNPIQLAKEFPLDKVVEILDHHPDGTPVSFPNASVKNEKIGSVCTLIAEQFRDERLFIPENIAGILALGIVSNTLNFTAPSTTDRDIKAFEWLKLFVCISNDLIMKLFESRSSIDNIDSYHLVSNNLKEFCWNGSKMGISQIEMINAERLIGRSDFNEALLQVKQNKSLNYIIFSGVDILEHKTFIVVPDKETCDILNKGMGYSFVSNSNVVDKILLRKTDFIPKLKSYFEKK